MKWNKKTDQVLRALIYLATENRIISSSELSSYMGIAQQTITQYAAPLQLAGIISVAAGNQGGYFLARCANEISMFDIVSALETDTIFPMKSVHDESYERIDSVYCFIENSITVIFKQISLSTLCSNHLQDIISSTKQSINIILARLSTDCKDKNVPICAAMEV